MKTIIKFTLHAFIMPFLLITLTTHGMDNPNATMTFYCPVTLKPTRTAFYLDQTPLQQTIFKIWGIHRNLNDPVVAVEIKEIPPLAYHDEIALLQPKNLKGGHPIPQALPISLFQDKNHKDILATMHETDIHGYKKIIHLTYHDSNEKPFKPALKERIKNLKRDPFYMSYGSVPQMYFEKKLLDHGVLGMNEHDQVEHGPCGYFCKKPKNIAHDKMMHPDGPVDQKITTLKNIPR